MQRGRVSPAFERELNLETSFAVDQPTLRNRIELDGEYDFSRKAELSELFGAIASNAEDLLIDMSRVNFADSSFFNALARLRERRHVRRITLICPHAQQRRLLSILAFDALFRIVNEEVS